MPSLSAFDSLIRLPASAVALLGVPILASAPLSGAVLTTNTFEFGTDGWTVGAPSPIKPTRISGDGPGGASDPYLFTQATDIPGPGGRLAVFNESPDWLGDFTAIGITSLTADFRNFGATPLTLRIGIEGRSPTNVIHRAVSTDTHQMASFSQWESAQFHLAPGDLVGAGIGHDPAIALQNVAQIRILHNPLPAYQGVQVGAALGLDNLQSIPEPRVAVLILMGALTVSLRRQRRQYFGTFSP